MREIPICIYSSLKASYLPQLQCAITLQSFKQEQLRTNDSFEPATNFFCTQVSPFLCHGCRNVIQSSCPFTQLNRVLAVLVQPFEDCLPFIHLSRECGSHGVNTANVRRRELASSWRMKVSGVDLHNQLGDRTDKATRNGMPPLFILLSTPNLVAPVSGKP